MNPGFHIALIVEGEEEEDYWNRLQNLGLILDKKHLTVINAKSISKIPSKFHEKYSSNRYFAVFVFCDTDDGYTEVKNTVNNTVGDGAADELVFFASPCSMTVLLAHFSNEQLMTTRTVNKKKNGILLKELGVSFEGDYDAKEEQRASIMMQINRANYANMKKHVTALPEKDSETPGTNVLRLLDLLEIGNEEHLNACIDKVNKIEQET